MRVCLLLFLFFLFARVDAYSQSTDSIVITKGVSPAGYERAYSNVVFEFYYLNTEKEIKIVALDIDDVRLSTDPLNGNGIIRVHLSNKKTYKVFVRHQMYMPSRVFDLNIDTNYDYVIRIYLSLSKRPAH